MAKSPADDRLEKIIKGIKLGPGGMIPPNLDTDTKQPPPRIPKSGRMGRLRKMKRSTNYG